MLTNAARLIIEWNGRDWMGALLIVGLGVLISPCWLMPLPPISLDRRQAYVIHTPYGGVELLRAELARGTGSGPD